MEKRERQSNLELLRIIAMITIVAGHFLAQSGARDVVTGKDLAFSYFVGSGSRIAVSLFLMIGIWFTVDADFSAKRILKLYSTLWFYCMSITAVSTLLGVKLTRTYFLKSFFPLWNGSCWFVPAYIDLLLLAPFLSMMLKWKKEVLRIFIIILFFLTCIKATATTILMDNWLNITLWFILSFLMIGYYKKYMHTTINISKYVLLFGGIIVYIILVLLKYWGPDISSSLFLSAANVASLWLTDYKSLPNLLCAFCIFYFFIHTDLGNNKVINAISSSTLAVYLIHQSPSLLRYTPESVCRCLLFTKVYNCDKWIGTRYYMIGFIGVIISLFLGASIIDRFRKRFIEPFWMKSIIFTKLSFLLEKFYQPVLKK